MIYNNATIGDGKIKIISSKTINQSDLNPKYCLNIQILGLSACERCEYLGKPLCGGFEIRKKLLEDEKSLDNQLF